MNNSEPGILGDITSGMSKNKRSKVIVTLSIFLVLSIGGNAFLGVSMYNYQKAYNNLKKDYEHKATSLIASERQLKQMKEEVKSYEETLKEAITLLEEYDSAYKKMKEQNVISRIPKGYYISSDTGGNRSYDDLKDFLNYDFFLPKNYTLGIFDCSESAAYLEYVLQNNGFDAKIVVGKDPVGSSVGHAWVLVNTDKGMAAIEPTVLTGGVKRFLDSLNNIVNNSARGVIYYNNNDQTSMNYYEAYDAIFEDIAEAVKYTGSQDEWNWWEGSWGFE
jgi:hypothetical protein